MRFRTRPLALLGALITTVSVLFPAASEAAELALEPILQSAMDQQRIVITPGGGAAVLLQDAILQADPGREPVSVAVCAADQSLALSDDGSAYGVTTHRHGAADFAPTATFTLRSATGDQIWSIGETEDVAYAISSQRRVVGLSLNINTARRNRIHFYGPDGRMLRDAAVPYGLGGRFSAQGNVFFAPSAQDVLYAFDADGRSLWTMQGVRLFASTPDGSVVAATGEGHLKLIENGQLRASLDLGDLLVRRIAIAPAGDRIAIAGKHEVRVYRTRGLVQLWRAESGDPALAITSVDIADHGRWTAVGVARDLGPEAGLNQRHPDGEVRVYDADGAQRHQASLAFDVWNIFSPTAVLAEDGASMTITTRRAVYRADLP